MSSLALAMAMAGASTILLLLLYASLQATFVDGANHHLNVTTVDYMFTYDPANDIPHPNLTRLGNTTLSNGALWLTPDPRAQQRSEMYGNAGWLVSAAPLTMLTNITSFHTSFQFQFITPSGTSDGGDGMTFFISPYHTIPEKSGGGFFGIANGTYMDAHLFAVEFDTYQNNYVKDPNNNHVGIDFNGVVSSITIDTNASSKNPHLDLKKNSSFMVWVDYYSSNISIEVRMLNITMSTSISRPLDPLLSTRYDLSTLFLDSDMFVGLSATTGLNYQGCAIYSWNFSLSTVVSIQVPRAVQTEKSGNSLLILISSILGGVVATGIMVAAIAYRKRCCCCSSDDDRMSELALIPQDVLVPAAMPRYTYKELWKATHGFNDKARVGRGGFSVVYKGRLKQPNADRSMCEVAIKRLNKEGLRKSDEFFLEIKMINALQHPRLVNLKGWCYEKGEAMLVYQFMSNGSLADHLFEKGEATMLTSEIRVDILKGVAEALNHLHAAGAVHRDVKAANVLLTSDFKAMLGDFGLLRLLKDDNHITLTMTAAGTPGYAAPELLFTRTPTDKVDVFSYGALALELACGRRIIDLSLDQPEDRMLLDWVWSKQESGVLLTVLDPRMDISGEMETMWRCILHLALHCCHPIPEERPPMHEVLDTILHGIVVPLDPSRPSYHGPYSSWGQTPSRQLSSSYNQMTW